VGDVVGSADYRLVSAEPRLPEPMADHDNTACLIFLGGQAADHWLHAKSGKERGRRDHHGQAIHVPFGAHRGLDLLEEADIFESLRVLAVLEVELGSESELSRHVGSGSGPPEYYQPVGPGEFEGFEKHRIK